jgi:hypothetical protein
VKKNRVAICLLLSAGWLVSARAGAPAGSRDGVAPPYPLKTLAPTGFSVFKGILDMAPVSESSSVAFAVNKSASGGPASLLSFQLSKTGACSSSRTFGSGMGSPRNAAALWIAASGSGPSAAGGYGLVYVFFEEDHSNPEWSTVTVRVAKFGATGQRTSAWKEIWRTTTPKGTYLGGSDLFACNRGDVIGVVFSVGINDVSPWRMRKSLSYFVEADLQTGGRTGAPVFLPVLGDGSFIFCDVYRPVWNGSYWLVPVADSVYSSPGSWDDLYLHEALVLAVSGDASHSVYLTEIESVKDPLTWYGELWLAPYPGSKTDLWLFIKKTKEIPEAQRRLEKDKHTFSLVRLNYGGVPVQTKKLTLGNLVHAFSYDPAYITYSEFDAFTPIVASDATGTPQLFLSRIHTTNLYKKNAAIPPHRYEQQFLLYAINARTGAATWKNWAVTQWANLNYGIMPIISVFPGGLLAVVNNLEYMSSPYAGLSTLSTFPDWVK